MGGSRGGPAAPEVDLHHPLILLDLLDRSLAEHAALVEHGHGARDVPNELHVVLDDQHRALLGDGPEQPRRLLGLLVRHQLGLLDHDHADLEPLLLAVAQAASPLAGLAGEPNALQGLVDLAPLLAVEPRAQRGQHALAAPGYRELEVLAHREVPEDRGGLELAPDAERGDLVLPPARQIGILAEDHASGGGSDLPRDDIEQGRLAGAIGADDHPQLAVVHVEVELAQRLEAVEIDGDVLKIDDGPVLGGSRGAHGRVTSGAAAPSAREATAFIRPPRTHASSRWQLPTTPSG